MRSVPADCWRDAAWIGMEDPEAAVATLATTPFARLLAGQVRARPQAIAVAHGKQKLGFADLSRATARLAHALTAGANPTAPVAILQPTATLFALALLGTLAAGRTALILDPASPPARHALILRDAGAMLLLGDGADTGTADIPVLDVAAFLTGTDLPPPVGWVAPDAPAVLLATSGSTGLPKLIVVSVQHLLYRMAGNAELLGLTRSDHVLCLHPPSTVAGVVTLFTIAIGAQVEMLDLARVGYRGLLDALANRSVTILRAGPSLLRGLLALPDAAAAFAGLHAVISAGEPLLRADVARLHAMLPAGCRIVNGYGATETSVSGGLTDIGDRQHPQRSPAGRLWPGIQAIIVDDDDRPCPRKVIGEVVIRSRWTALGEWQDGKLVPGRLVPDVTDPRRRIYRTGDAGCFDANDVLVVLGRADRMVNVNGLRVELAEIETSLRTAPFVAEAVVVARTDRTGGTVLGAFVVAADAAPAELARRLRARLRDSLPPHMRPRRLMLVAKLPRLSSGKIDEAGLWMLVSEVTASIPPPPAQRRGRMRPR